MKNDGIPMIPGVEPILLDLENPFLPSRDLKNRRKTKKLEINMFKKNKKIKNIGKIIVCFLYQNLQLVYPLPITWPV